MSGLNFIGTRPIVLYRALTAPNGTSLSRLMIICFPSELASAYIHLRCRLSFREILRARRCPEYSVIAATLPCRFLSRMSRKERISLTGERERVLGTKQGREIGD